MDLRIDSRPSRARVAQLAEQGTLNPKVQGSIPCASTIMLCLRASGRASVGPDVSIDGGHLAGIPRLTAYVTAYKSGTKPRAVVTGGLGLNSAGVLLPTRTRLQKD